jgi:hypothetical protein
MLRLREIFDGMDFRSRANEPSGPFEPMGIADDDGPAYLHELRPCPRDNLRSNARDVAQGDE